MCCQIWVTRLFLTWDPTPLLAQLVVYADLSLSVYSYSGYSITVQYSTVRYGNNYSMHSCVCSDFSEWLRGAVCSLPIRSEDRNIDVYTVTTL